jgi:hypothetical protein
MALDRYSKLVFTVIAVCLVWLSFGGPSLMTPVSAAVGDRVVIVGWMDENGNTRSFPNPPPPFERRRPGDGPSEPIPSFPFPIWDATPR